MGNFIPNVSKKCQYFLEMCNIWSYRQESPKPARSVRHRHYSSREVRIMQGVEYRTRNDEYMCPTCMTHHKARTPQGLNVCLSASQLHDIHRPMDPDVVCPPDSTHVDWITIPGATISTLEEAWFFDFKHQRSPPHSWPQ